MKSIFRQLVSHPASAETEPVYKELNSDLIKSTRYELATQHMHIRFQDGRETIYCRVSPQAYNAFLNAESYTDYFYSFIHMRYLKYPAM